MSARSPLFEGQRLVGGNRRRDVHGDDDPGMTAVRALRSLRLRLLRPVARAQHLVNGQFVTQTSWRGVAAACRASG